MSLIPKVKLKHLLQKKSVAVLLCAVLIFLLGYVGREIYLDHTQETLISLLEENRGSYNEGRIVLSPTSPKQAQKVAEAFRGTLRITANGKFAVIDLPDGMSLWDVANNETYSAYHGQIKLDYTTYRTADEAEDELEMGSWNTLGSDEPLLPQQGYLSQLNLGNTWELTQGKTGAGEKVRVAIIDTGIDTDHPEFFDKDGNTIISSDSYNSSSDSSVKAGGFSVIEDTQGHGTAVASVLAAQVNGTGMTGIAPDVELLIIKCDADKSGTFTSYADLIFAVYYAIEMDADVVNMSFGGSYDPELARALQLAVDSDIICVASAGNDGSTQKQYPAAFTTVIGVGALEAGGWEIAEYSNFGDNSDIMAPGSALTAEYGGGYSYSNGTSIAAPMVSAAAALYVAYNKYVTYEDFRNDLFASGKDLGVPGDDLFYGFGALDIDALICQEKGILTYDYCTDEMESTEQVFVRQHTIQFVEDPERDHVIFDDWYYDKAYTRVFSYEEWYTTEFVEDITLYAKWVNEDDEGASVYRYKNLPDGTIEITGYKGKRRYLEIPYEIDGKVVSAIGPNAFSGNTRLREIIFPEGLTRIGSSAFYGAQGLRKVTFRGTRISFIEERAFYHCIALRSIDIPDSVISIGEFAFAGCYELSEVKITENSNLVSFGKEAFANAPIIHFYIPRNVTADGFNGDVLAGCTQIRGISLHPDNNSFTKNTQTLLDMAKSTIVYHPAALTGSVIVPDTVRTIGRYAFASSRISEITWNYVERIEDSAFLGASRLRNVVLPESLVFLGGSAFSQSGLTSVTIPQNLEVIAKYAFIGCSNLTSVAFAEDSSLKEIEYGAFGMCSVLSSLELPELLQVIGDGAFRSCEMIESIRIPGEVHSLGEYAFADCRRLESVDFASECPLQSISKGCFYHCTKLTSVIFSDAIEEICSSAFSNNSQLKDLTFGANSRLRTVGNYAFYHCGALSDMQLPETVANIGDFAYTDSGISSLMVTAIMQIGKGSFGACDQLTQITVEPDNPWYAAVDNVLFDKTISTVYCVPASRAGSYTLPDTVKIIAPYALYENKLLEEVILPQGLEDIQQNAFVRAAITQIVIPANVTNIGREAFYECRNLASVQFAQGSKLSRLGTSIFTRCAFTEIKIPASVETIGQYAFANCPSLVSVIFEENSKLSYIPAYIFQGTKLKSVTFENGSALTHVQANAFNGLATLEKVDFGDAKITTIDNYAFYGCKALSELSIPADLTYIGRYAFYDCNGLDRMELPEGMDYIGTSAFVGTNQIRLFFREDHLPAYAQPGWDNGILGYYLGCVDAGANEDWEYLVRVDGTIELTKYIGSDAVLDINMVDGYYVSRIGLACFKDNNTIARVTLANGITRIGNHAFDGCKGLQTITIPASVQEIGKYAFANTECPVEIADQSVLKTIGEYAFANSGLTSITLPDSLIRIEEGAFYKCAVQTVVLGETSNLRSIGRQAFAESKIATFVLPQTLESVGVEAFRDTANLLSVEICGGDTALKLYHSAFAGSGLREITIPARVNYIGEYVFAGCQKLTNIYVDASNTSYTSLDGVLCNSDTTSILQFPGGRSGTYEIPAQIQVLNYACFKGAANLEEITFAPDSVVKTIGWQTFSGCSKLKKITIPACVISIDAYAFENCAALETVILENGTQLEGVYTGAFYGCVSLTDFVLPDAVVDIGAYAFYNCSSLTQFPCTGNSLLKGIGEYAFYGCSAITNVPHLADLADIGDYAFAYTGLTNFTVSAKIHELPKNVFRGCVDLMNFYCDDESEHFAAISGILFEKGAYSATDYEALVAWPYGRVLTIGVGKTVITKDDTAILGHLYDVNWTIADSVTTIEWAAFQNHRYLKSITIPENIKTIGNYAFQGCWSIEEIHFNAIRMDDMDTSNSGGTHIFEGVGSAGEGIVLTIGKNVKKIPNGLFDTYWYSVPIKELIFEEGTSCEQIGSLAFSGCKKLETVIIPDTVTVVGYSAFSGCTGIKKLVVPACVTKLGGSAFYDCSGLQTAGPIGSGCDYEFGWTDTIPDYAFDGCFGLKTVYIPDGITRVGQYYEVFDGNKSLEEVRYPSSVTFLCQSTYNGASYFTKRIIMESKEIIQTLTSATSYGNMLKSVHTLMLPAGMEGVTSYVLEHFPQTQRVCIDGVEYDTYSDHIHEWDAGQLRREHIICKQDGLKVFTCGVCGLENHETVVAHPWNVERTEATCTADGLESYFCPVCQKTEQVILKSPGHAFGYWYSISNNKSQRDCSTCGGAETGDFYTRASGSCGDHIDWVYKGNGELWIYGYGRMDDWSSVSRVPWYGRSVDSIVIENGITNVGTYAFYNQYSLEEATLPDSLTAIGTYAFSKCPFLTQLDIPDNVTSIASNAFEDCTRLEALHFPDGMRSIGAYLCSGCRSLKDVTLPSQLESIGQYAFEECAFESIVIPKSTLNIGASAFASCKSLRSIVLPEGISVLRGSLFSGCEALESIVIPENAETIEASVFAGCSSLKAITIPKNVQTINPGVFQQCHSLSAIEVHSENQFYVAIAGNLYNKAGTVLCAVAGGKTGTLTIPEGVTTIGQSAFAGHSKITNIVFPDTVIMIGSYAFSRMSAIETIVIPESVRTIGDYAFSYMSAAKNIVLPEGLTTIGQCAFSEMPAIETIILPSSVTSIGTYAFTQSGLRYITIPSKCTSLSDGLFWDCENLETVVLPNTLTSIGQSTFESCSKLKSITIPAGVTALLKQVFDGCTGLEEVVFKGNTVDIWAYAFADCTSLSKIVLPATVKGVSKNAFNGCKNLKQVIFTGNKPSSIDSRAFVNVTATIIYPADNDTWTESIMQNYGGTLTWQQDCGNNHTAGDPVRENEKQATCTVAGSYDRVTYCSVCGREVSRETVAVPAAHTPGAAVKENETAGSYESVVYCTACGAELSRETIATHTHTLIAVEAKDPTYAIAGNTAYYYCDCGKYFSDTEGANEIAEGSWVVPALAVGKDNALAIKPTSTGTYATLLLGAELKMSFNVSAKDTAAYDRVFLQITKLGKTTDVEVYSSNSVALQFRYALAAPEMTVAMTVAVCGEKDGQIYVGEMVTFTYRDIVIDKMDAFYNGTNETNKVYGCALLANLLKYGEEAQKRFGINTDDLATSGLSETYLAMINTATPALDTWTAPAKATYYLGSYSPMLQEQIKIAFTFVVPEYSSLEGYEVRIVQTMSKDGSLKEHIFGADDLKNPRATQIRCDFAIAGAEGRDQLAITLYKDGVAVSETVVTNLSALAQGKQSDALNPLLYAMVNYCDAAKVFFG